MIHEYATGTTLKQPFVSVVIPVYGCGRCLFDLFERLSAVLPAISDRYEIIMVNDASPDDSWKMINTLSQADNRVRGINLSRNFGQHNAITAGLDYAQGDWVVVMDCDLQHRPEEIPKLYNKAQEGYDLVVGMRNQRQDSYLKKLGSRLFYWILSYSVGFHVDSRLSNFGIYSKKVIRSITTLKEQNRPFGLLALWVGFRRIEIDIEHASRPYGKSSYNYRKMINLALDSILSYSDKVLRTTVKLGLLLSLISLLYASLLVLRYFFWSKPIQGWTSLIVSLYFTTGLIIGCVGVVGLYVDKVFNEVKHRPIYLIDSTTFDLDLNSGRMNSGRMNEKALL